MIKRKVTFHNLFSCLIRGPMSKSVNLQMIAKLFKRHNFNDSGLPSVKQWLLLINVKKISFSKNL